MCTGGADHGTICRERRHTEAGCRGWACTGMAEGSEMPFMESKPWENRLREAANLVEQDLNRVVTYINDEVMPDVRRNGSNALKAAALELERLARRIDEANRSGAQPPPKV